MKKRGKFLFRVGLTFGILLFLFIFDVSGAEAGRLNIPLFSQLDRHWSREKLGHSALTIGRYGCALTSKAMVFNYYHKNWTDPGKLNRYLRSHGGYANGCSMRWNNTGVPGGVSYRGQVSLSKRALNQKISAGYPLIAQVYKVRVPMHFVVITGGNYSINDPWGGKRTTLSAQRYYLKRLHLYQGEKKRVVKPAPRKSSPSLRITQGLWLKRYNKGFAGEPFDAQFVVKNFSRKTIKVKNLSLFVRGPRGENLDLGGSGRITLKPGKSFRLFKKTNQLGRYNLKGTYRFGCSYQDLKGKWHLLPVGRKGAVSKRKLRVVNPSYKASYLKSFSLTPKEIVEGKLGRVVLKFKNTGTASWHRDGKYAVRLGTWNRRDHHSKFFDPRTWRSRGRIELQQKVVRPGRWGSFVFNLQTFEVSEESSQKETFRLVCERRTWFDHRSQVVLSFRLKPDEDHKVQSFRDDFDNDNKVENLDRVVIKNGQAALSTWRETLETKTRSDFDRGDYLDLFYDQALGGVKIGTPQITILFVHPRRHSKTLLRQIIDQYAPDPKIFEVVPVTINNFNQRRLDSGQVLNLDQFDLLYFGIADVYGSNPPHWINDLNTTGENLVRQFHRQGKGVIFTHDTLGAGSPCWLKHNYFDRLSDITGIGTDTGLGKWHYFSEVKLNPQIDSEHPMLNYPFEIPNIFSVLSVHRLYQKVIKGDTFAYGSVSTDLYWQAFNNSTFFSYGHHEKIPLEWEGKALVNVLYNTYQGGIYTSKVFDLKSEQGGITTTFDIELPALTEGDLEIRSGGTQVLDESWTDWMEVDNGGHYSKGGRFVQYRAKLKSFNLAHSPILREVKIITDPLYHSEGMVTSIVIHPEEISKWLSFDVDYNLNGGEIRFELLNGETDGVIIADLQKGQDLSGINPNLPFKLRARLSTGDLLKTPQLESWEVFYQQ